MSSEPEGQGLLATTSSRSDAALARGPAQEEEEAAAGPSCSYESRPLLRRASREHAEESRYYQGDVELTRRSAEATPPATVLPSPRRSPSSPRLPSSEVEPLVEPEPPDRAPVLATSTTDVEGPAQPQTAAPELPASPTRTSPPSPLSSSSASDSPRAGPAQAAGDTARRRRRSIWSLPCLSRDVTWLHITNSLVFFILFAVNVLVNSEAVWQSYLAVDKAYGPVLTPASWAYHIRDLMFFLWAMAIGIQQMVEHKGWKEGLLELVGHSWQILWYSDTVWLIMTVTASPMGLTLAPLFSLCALLAALGAQTRLAWGILGLHLDLQAEGHEGVSPLGYLFFVAPTSLASGWLLVLHCHATTMAVKAALGSDTAAMYAGCVALAMAAFVALLILIRFRDIIFGLAFTWSMGSIWIAGFSTNDDYRSDQLVAFFCALVIGLLTYCIAAGPTGRAA
ncbi:hypothetical protein HYH03_003988 [Edaphochlamys debaryana]|uniref:Uncharacterized protein n=1 Tax=Edaphochlamys debaryana TaxID=47281 RepID=A0A836C3W7_9CHLO|nr:hypothetical protein HYH03_003988 [Edaphochlamys debaryana]|eukprot:KAG2498238.1 hypothetical protein HYH03_003988 [Edaphochlamys debaryana]